MADKKISELLNTTSLTGEEPIPMVQNNSTVKASVNKIVNGLSEALTLKTGTVQASADVDALFLKSDPGGASDGAMISLHSNDSNTSNQIYYKGTQHIFNTTSDTRLLTLNQNGASIGDEDPQDPDGNELLTRVEIESLVENQIQAEQSSNLSENGYQILPSGLIMQWGSLTPSVRETTVTLPYTFPTTCLNVQTTIGEDFTDSSYEDNSLIWGGYPKSGEETQKVIIMSNLRVRQGGVTYRKIFWQAIGY